MNIFISLAIFQLIPWKNNLWWIGASNELNFTTEEPTEEFFQSTAATLKTNSESRF